MKETGKKKKNDRHVYGVFLRIIKKGIINARILLLELPTGKFIDGIIPFETIKRVRLRDIISVCLTDIRPVRDINKLINNDKYNSQPSVYPNDINTDLL